MLQKHWAVMQVRAALASKVSRERFGTELEGIMSGMSLLVHYNKVHVNLWASVDLPMCNTYTVWLLDMDGHCWPYIARKGSSLLGLRIHMLNVCRWRSARPDQSYVLSTLQGLTHCVL